MEMQLEAAKQAQKGVEEKPETAPSGGDSKEAKKLKMENQFLKQQLEDLQEQKREESETQELLEQMGKLNEYISRLDSENDELAGTLEKKNEMIKQL